MKRRTLFLLAALLLLLAVPTGAVLAAPGSQTVVDDEDVIRNDVVLLNDDFELKDGGRVNGDVILFNGNADIAGTVNGDVVLFNGNLTVQDTATLSGDCVLFNGTPEGEGASNFACENLNVVLPEGLVNFVTEIAADSDFGSIPTTVDVDTTVEYERPSGFVRFLGGTAAAIGRSLLYGLLAFAAASLIPQPMMRIEEAVRTKPAASGAVGLLTTISMPFVVAILALVSAVLILACGLGLLGFPLIIALVLGIVVAGFLGWFTVGNIVGEFLAQRLSIKNRSQPMTTALGTTAITFVIGFLGAIPFVFGEGLISAVILFLGLGAATLTKLGTRAYPIVAAPVLNSDKITAVLDTLPDEPDSSD